MPIIEIEHLSHRYGDRAALSDLSLRIGAGDIFGFLGPNGSGKTTLFRILATLIPVARGQVKLLGLDAADHRDEIRRQIGVVFQSPSLDRQLTARENLMYQGHLYGLGGADLRSRVESGLDAVGLSDRADDRVEKFSGGMRRRVDVAKGLLHRPRILLLDEPSTGLDPGARIDLWTQFRQINREHGVTLLITTHLMEEAESCAQLAILAGGTLIAADTPAALKDRIGGDIIRIATREPAQTQTQLKMKLGIESQAIDGYLRLERPRGHELIPRIIEAAPGLIDSVSVGKPTLEDVFVQLTGRTLGEVAPAPVISGK